MAFKLQPNPTFKLPVRLPGGAEGPLMLTVKHKTKEQFLEFIEIRGMSDTERLGSFIEGWDGDAPYCQPALEKLLADFPGAGVRIYAAYVAELSGAAGKN